MDGVHVDFIDMVPFLQGVSCVSSGLYLVRAERHTCSLTFSIRTRFYSHAPPQIYWLLNASNRRCYFLYIKNNKSFL